MAWPEPFCQPFRRLLCLPRMVRVMLDLVGPGFHHSSANGIVMDAGAEGQRMHGGQRSDGANGHVRKTPSWPRSWVNLSPFHLYFRGNAWAKLHLLGH